MDKSNGYEKFATRYMATRDTHIGVSTVRAWCRTLPAGAQVLDLGCGHGEPITRVLLESGFRVFGVDASPTLIAEFKKRFPDVAAECAAAEESVFFHRKFDAIAAWGLLFLLEAETQSRVLHNVAAKLKPASKFLFTAPKQRAEWCDALTGHPSFSLGREEYLRLLRSTGLQLDDEATDEGDNHYYFVSKPPREAI